MAFAPAGGEAALGAWTLVAALGFVVCFGLLQAWDQTVGLVFTALANVKIPIKFAPDVHPFAFLGKVNHAVDSHLSDWADKCQKEAGLAMHYMAELYEVMAKEISQLSADSLAVGNWFHYRAIPAAIDTALGPWRTKTNKTAAAAAAAVAAAALAKKAAESRSHSQAGSEATTKAQAGQAARTATHTETVVHSVERTVVHDTKVITQVIDVGSIPAQLGRTVTSIRRRLGRVEALAGATAMSIAMANVLGLASPRCLRDGPLGRFSRALCGVPGDLLGGLLGGLLVLEGGFSVVTLAEGLLDVEDELIAGMRALVTELNDL